MDKDSGQIKEKVGRGAGSLLLVRLSLLILAGLQFVIIPRLLGPDGMGFYSYWLSLFFILTALLGLGGFPLLSRYIPEMLQKDETTVGPLVKKLLLIKIPVFILLLLAGPVVFPADYKTFWIISSAALLGAAELIAEGVIFGYNRIRTFSVMPLFRILFRILLLMTLFPFLDRGGILLAVTAAPLLTIVSFSPVWIKLIPKGSKRLYRPFSEYLNKAIWLYLTNILSILTFWLVIGVSRFYQEDISRIGFLGLALQVSLMISFMLFSLSQSLLPTLVRFHLSRDRRLGTSLRLSWKYTNIILFPVITFLLFLSRSIILILVGEEFLGSVPLIRLFVPCIVLFSWIFLLEQILIVHEKMRSLFFVEFFRLLVFLITALYLVSEQGLSGGPVALTAGSLFGLLILFPMTLKLNRIENFYPAILKPLLAAGVMIIPMHFISHEDPWELFYCLIVSLVTYFILLYLIRGVGRHDLKILKLIITGANVDKGEISAG